MLKFFQNMKKRCEENENIKFFSLQFEVPIAANYKGVCLQNTSKFHSYHLMQDMEIIMTLWLVNGAVHKSSSQWQLKEFWK